MESLQMIIFQKRYFTLTVLLFAIEVLIALLLHDRFIRPHVGDFLVVILIYCFIRSFFKTPVIATALAVLVFAYVVELMQYFNLIGRLGLQKSRLANLILGNLFQWEDMVAYTLGIGLVILLEKITAPSNSRRLRPTRSLKQ